jgi:putative heme iron utilization protein
MPVCCFRGEILVKIAPTAALQLLHGQHYATLATHAGQLPGYPYATVLPYVLDEQHRPLLLISALAEHTRNLLADGRCSLSVLEAGAERRAGRRPADLAGRCAAH